MKPTKSKTALVTGASRGIGRAIALSLARQGWNIAINYHQSDREAEVLATSMRQYPVEVVLAKANLAVTDEIEPMIERIHQQLGEILVLVNNAGITRPLPIENISEKDWDVVVNTNLKSAFLVTQAVIPDMRHHQWGRIINISSVAAQLGGVVGPHYAASKAGMHGLTHAYSAMLVKEGITANTIAPALIETDMVTSNPKARPELIPVGRFGKTEEVASVVNLLVENGYITGQTINVNGGWYMS